MSVAQLIEVAVISAVISMVGGVVAGAIHLALEKEYGTWAPALARLLVRLAGLLCPSHRGKWWADLRYLQRVERQSGLFQAGWCLVCAPWLALRDAALTTCTQGRRAIGSQLVRENAKGVALVGVAGVGFVFDALFLLWLSTPSSDAASMPIRRPVLTAEEFLIPARLAIQYPASLGIIATLVVLYGLVKGVSYRRRGR
jgi:hypothetical protein